MSGTSRAWIVAASLGAVEAMKDQGFCRWNYAIRCVHQHAKNHLRSMSQANRFSSSYSSVIAKQIRDGEERIRESEESLRKVMYLSCWGPN